MSGYADGAENSVGVVRDLSTAAQQRAAAYVQRRATAGDWPADEVAAVLEHLGLRPPEKPAPGHTNPVGKNVTPESERKRRERVNARKRAARDRKAKEAS